MGYYLHVFFGFLWTGEVVTPSDLSFDSLTHLTYGDVRMDNVEAPQYLEVKIKASKMDPFCQGVSVYIGVTAGDLCPVACHSGLYGPPGLGWGSFLSLSEREIPHPGPVCSSDESGLDPSRVQ